MGFLKKQKPRIHKHLAFDSDIFERAEQEAASENKSLNEWLNEAARARIETIDKATEQPQPQLAPRSHEDKTTLTLNEADRIVRDQITPSIYERNPETREDKDNFVSLRKSFGVLLETVEIKLNKRRRLEFPPIPHLSPFEKARQEGLKKAREMREKNERIELMSVLPKPIDVMEKVDIDTDIGTPTTTTTATTGTGTIALTTSSTARVDLSEAEYLALKRQEEERNKRLEAYSKELTTKMRAQAKDGVKLVDESKEIQTEDNGEEISIPPEDQGVYDDDSEKVSKEEF